MKVLKEHPRAIDVAVCAAVLIMSVAWLVRADHPVEHAGLELGLAIGMTLPLAFRRRRPSWVFCAIAALAFVQWLADIGPRAEDVAILVALYTVAAYGKRIEAAVATGIVVCGVLMAVSRWRFEDFVPALIAPTALALVAFFLGDDLRNRRAYLAELEERAGRLEREQEAQTRAAVAAERADIARELHDVVAHNLSVMVVQAEAATYAFDDHPDQARAAMAAVGSTGRQALSEMRRLLGVLRPSDGTQTRAPQPGVEQLEQLVSGVRKAGLPVDLSVSGPANPLPAGMELAVYRIVQEALTNTIKHAGIETHSRVELRYGDADVEVHIEDDGGDAPAPADDHGGQGLLGMRERAGMYGGTVETGPRPEGGFSVTARFPAGLPA